MMATVERLEIAEPTAPYVYTEMFLLTSKPEKYVDPFAFAMSFSLEVWIGIFFSMLLVTAVLTFDKCVRKKDTKNLLRKFGSSLWLSCTYFFTSAKHKRVKNVSTRIMLATWSFSVFVVVILLSSRLVSTMLTKSDEDHVDTLEDVLRFPKLKILAERGTAFDDFLMKPKTAFFQQIQRQVEIVAGSIAPGPLQDDFFDHV
ncbi:glutamate receptor ionotropic, NMDA 2B-like [Dermacentor albipictus]|uniref:glutamate receptor ionotropic, NMDA 2B-like n=1 Tax=Dermacentor albipictus TaxID=60249 RepID=UPI0038FC5C85